MNQKDWKNFKTATDCHICSKPLLKETYRDGIHGFDPNTGAHKGEAHKKCFFNANVVRPMNKRKLKTIFNDACYICEKSLIKHAYKDSVRDHCLITGKFRGAAHNDCNFKLKINPKTVTIPIVFHNLKGYDGHLLMQAISKVEGKISCIPNNTEKYISFSLGKLRFIDSAQFLLASLDDLVKAQDPTSMRITMKYEPNPDKRELLLRKGVYPYEYMDDWRRFEEHELPPQDAFYSKLTDEGINDKVYQHAKKVWKSFKCKTMGDYHDLYLRTDVLLLADVFENFRTTNMKNYKHDPAHHYTSPGLSWDNLLKYSDVELGLLTDAPISREGSARWYYHGE